MSDNEDKPLKRLEDGAITTNVEYLDKVSLTDKFKIAKENLDKALNLQKRQKILDLGCGLGDDVIRIAKKVGDEGKVVGIDVNEEAIKVALKKQSSFKNVEFICQNAEILPFEDNYFDASRAERVFQHLMDVQTVFKEMIRVTKPDGKILVVDPDWQTLIINSEDKNLTNKIVKGISEIITNGWMGRELPPLFREFKLKKIEIESYWFFSTDLQESDLVLALTMQLNTLKEEKKVTEEEVSKWWQELEQKDKDGQFFMALLAISVMGQK